MKQPLPKGWAKVALCQIAEVRLGRQRSPSRATGPNMVPYLRAANVTWSGVDLSDVKEMDFTPDEQEVYRLQSGDILLSEASGSAHEVGKPAIWRGQIDNCCFQNTLIRVRAVEQGLAPYLHRHFLADALTGRFGAASRGVGIHHLGAEAMSQWEVVIPPAKEREHLVNALDAYLSRIDETTTTLDGVQRNLKRYRASVLKAAVEGRLVPTEAELARAEKRDYEPASVLLKRILTERRQRWEKEGRRGKYEEPEPPDTKNLPKLPEGWCWTTLDQLVLSIEGGTAATATSTVTTRPVLRSSAVRHGYVDLDDIRYLPDTTPYKDSGFIAEGDLLFTRLSGTLEYVGNCACVPDLNGRWLEFPDRIFRARCGSFVCKPFVQLCFRERDLRKPLEQAAKSTAGHQRISLADLRGFVLPLPPLAEQVRIASEVDARLSVIRALDTTVVASCKRAHRLRQSILKWAFEGKLVGQDPNDEPASALLARIKGEQPTTTAPKAAPRRRAKTA